MYGAETADTIISTSPPRNDALHASLWRDALDSLDAAVCIVDRNLRVMAASRAWDTLARNLGRLDLMAAQLTGQSVLDVLSVGERERWQTVCQRLFDGEEASYWTEFAWPSPGGACWIRLTARTLFNDRGVVTGLSLLLVDFTEDRRHAEEALKRKVELRGLYEVAQSVGMVSDTTELFRRVTGHLAYLFGARVCAVAMPDGESERALIRIPVHGLGDDQVAGVYVPLSLMAVEDRLMPYLLLDDAARGPEALRALADRWQVRSLLIAPLRNQGRSLGYLLLADAVGAFTDESGRLLATFAGLIAAALDANTLVLTLQDRADQLSVALTELQELDRLKDQLVQNVSHELRLPLMVIQGYSDLLKAGAFGRLEPDLQQAIDVISEKAAVLGKRVGDIVLLRGLQQADLCLERLPLAELVHQAVSRAQANAEAHHVALVVDAMPDANLVVADRRRIGQVIDQLIDNAIKFSPNGGEIRLAVREGGDVVYLKVSDQGVGIPAAHLDRVWDRFYQSDGSTTRRFGGVGVGLTLVKQIVEAHGGQVWVESEEGRGSRFYVALRRSDVDLARPLSADGTKLWQDV